MDPEQQIDHVERLAVGLDELALEFDDVSGTRFRLVAEGALTPTQAAAIAAVDRHLSQMTSAGPTRWTENAVRTGEDWAHLRKLARLAVSELD